MTFFDWLDRNRREKDLYRKLDEMTYAQTHQEEIRAAEEARQREQKRQAKAREAYYSVHTARRKFKSFCIFVLLMIPFLYSFHSCEVYNRKKDELKNLGTFQFEKAQAMEKIFKEELSVYLEKFENDTVKRSVRDFAKKDFDEYTNNLYRGFFSTQKKWLSEFHKTYKWRFVRAKWDRKNPLTSSEDDKTYAEKQAGVKARDFAFFEFLFAEYGSEIGKMPEKYVVNVPQSFFEEDERLTEEAKLKEKLWQERKKQNKNTRISVDADENDWRYPDYLDYVQESESESKKRFYHLPRGLSFSEFLEHEYGEVK